MRTRRKHSEGGEDQPVKFRIARCKEEWSNIQQLHFPIVDLDTTALPDTALSEPIQEPKDRIIM